MSLKIILVDDHILVRQGMSALLRGEPSLEIAGEARNGLEAIDLCEKVKPDLVLMDIHMPVMNGVECTRILRKTSPETKVLAASLHNNTSYLMDMMSAGAHGYVLKNAGKEELLLAICKVSNGSYYISPELSLTVLEDYKSSFDYKSSSDVIVPLSEGEREILTLIAEGLTNTQMAQKLFISIRTVESRRKKLLDKTGTTNAATLIKFALKNNMVS